MRAPFSRSPSSVVAPEYPLPTTYHSPTHIYIFSPPIAVLLPPLPFDPLLFITVRAAADAPRLCFPAARAAAATTTAPPLSPRPRAPPSPAPPTPPRSARVRRRGAPVPEHERARQDLRRRGRPLRRGRDDAPARGLPAGAAGRRVGLPLQAWPRRVVAHAQGTRLHTIEYYLGSSRKEKGSEM